MQQNFLRFYLRAMMALLFFICLENTQAQVSLYDTLPHSERLNFYASANSEDLNIKFTQVPDKLFNENMTLRINDRSVTYSFPIIDGENYSIALPHRSSPYSTDTIYFSIEMNDHVYHTIALIISSGFMRNISFGKGCYELDCTPVQDPYMPSVVVPFLIDPQATYKIPGRNKVISGKKALNRYTPCELEKFEQVFFQDN